MSLFDAVVVYLRLRGGGKGITHQAAERACGYSTDTCGKLLTGYTVLDAHAFRDALSARDMTGSNITSVFVKWGRLTNPFGEVYSHRSQICRIASPSQSKLSVPHRPSVIAWTTRSLGWCPWSRIRECAPRKQLGRFAGPRAVECPADIVGQMGGWKTETVGHGYGNGYALSVL
ncbi:hypothetical protein [Limimaricola sp. AA108-03]|uniref:hypothetical protein n=1 Tax=Limimaricola sp. AA108-03 TaxID=3425945 RepID=UPI003D786801